MAVCAPTWLCGVRARAEWLCVCGARLSLDARLSRQSEPLWDVRLGCASPSRDVAMDFTKTSALECKRASYRAHVRWNDKGTRRHIRGPCRPHEQTAQHDLDSMREAAKGLSRAEGVPPCKPKHIDCLVARPRQERVL